VVRDNRGDNDIIQIAESCYDCERNIAGGPHTGIMLVAIFSTVKRHPCSYAELGARRVEVESLENKSSRDDTRGS
jgi:hypothetical protein